MKFYRCEECHSLYAIEDYNPDHDFCHCTCDHCNPGKLEEVTLMVRPTESKTDQ